MIQSLNFLITINNDIQVFLKCIYEIKTLKIRIPKREIQVYIKINKAKFLI